jgi:hypothetical protein
MDRRRSEDALKAAERALSLVEKSQSPDVRLAVAAASCRVRAAAGGPDDSCGLEPALAEAARLGLRGRQLEIRLVQGEIGIIAGRGAAESALSALARDARARRFALVARKAEAILRSPAAERRRAS